MKTNGTKKQGTTSSTSNNNNSNNKATPVRRSATALGLAILKPEPLDLGAISNAVRKAVDDLGSVASELPGLIVLDPGTKQRTAKVPTGAEVHAQQMTIAARMYPDYISVGTSAQGMSDALAFLAEMRAVQAAVGDLKKRVDDTIYAAQSGVWKESLDVYAALQRQALVHPEILPVIESLATFLSRSPAVVPVANGAAGGAGSGVGSGVAGGAASGAANGSSNGAANGATNGVASGVVAANGSAGVAGETNGSGADSTVPVNGTTH
jgi:hypothetical protein